MARCLMVLTLAMAVGCASSRPSYVRSDFESVEDVTECAKGFGRAALLVTIVAVVAVLAVVGYVAESEYSAGD